MPFIDRDADGNITGVFSMRQHDEQEEVADSADIVKEFRERKRVSEQIVDDVMGVTTAEDRVALAPYLIQLEFFVRYKDTEAVAALLNQLKGTLDKPYFKMLLSKYGGV